MLWAWAVVPVLPWLLREPSLGDAQGRPPPPMPRRALAGRIACGVLWFAGVHEALQALGDAAANAIYHDTGAAFLAAGRTALYVLLVAVVAWHQHGLAARLDALEQRLRLVESR